MCFGVAEYACGSRAHSIRWDLLKILQSCLRFKMGIQAMVLPRAVIREFAARVTFGVKCHRIISLGP